MHKVGVQADECGGVRVLVCLSVCVSKGVAVLRSEKPWLPQMTFTGLDPRTFPPWKWGEAIKVLQPPEDI